MSRMVELYHYFKAHMADPYPEAAKADRAVSRRLRGLQATEDDKKLIFHRRRGPRNPGLCPGCGGGEGEGEA
ncbi:MAG: hypothetical protein ACLSAF_15510 [Intestinimonas sp.]